MIHLKDDDPGREFPVELVLYIAICVFLMVIVLMMKLLTDSGDSDGDGGGARASETSGLLCSKVEGSNWFISSSYGTNEEWNGDKNCTSSSDDFYDGKICVICYDDETSCLFIPCGHSITCYTCAKRLISEEIKSCPICRTEIDKVRKLHIL
ncbi:E3 ubiquitin-protein ligase APD2 isoform X2 [Salvia miltiorrhiza]|uniref:E3 ubiquitin-protein ligase APD2 isoform X2 n=1 Tax=Salvia miltiorrhiza TaxID=226208 RepID=UPI0025AD3CBC|nr:E3 ubiquitin-protein ligase APD2 isoform X2 [Salvia miltiorrhiza]